MSSIDWRFRLSQKTTVFFSFNSRDIPFHIKVGFEIGVCKYYEMFMLKKHTIESYPDKSLLLTKENGYKNGDSWKHLFSDILKNLAT